MHLLKTEGVFNTNQTHNLIYSMVILYQKLLIANV